jgi:predicted nuclease with TOPRIM domain
MEILITGLVLGLLALVGLAVKFSSEETGQQKKLEDAKNRKIADLETEIARRDTEFKKIKADYQKLEDEFFKAKDDADIFKKENTEITQKAKQAEKLKEESGSLREELKQKETILQQEIIARQKLQGEVSLADAENEKLKKEVERVNNELKSKTEMFDGLKGQFNELENELEKIGMGQVKPPKVEPLKVEPQKVEPPKVKPPKAEPILKQPQELKKEAKTESLRGVEQPPKESKPQEVPRKQVDDAWLSKKQEEPKTETKQDLPKKPDLPKSQAEIPGFVPKQPSTKTDTKLSVLSDMEFLKAAPPKKEETAPSATDIPEGTFKLTNVNKPTAPTPQAPDAKKDKDKSKKETLIPGFHPKDEKPSSPPPL